MHQHRDQADPSKCWRAAEAAELDACMLPFDSLMPENAIEGRNV